MSTRRKNQSYSPEFRAEAVRQVIEGSRPIAAVARELAVIEQTLGNWVKAWRDEHALDEPPLSVPERIRALHRSGCRGRRRVADRMRVEVPQGWEF